MKSDEAKRIFAHYVNSLKFHYEMCSQCSKEPSSCFIGSQLWVRISRAYIDMMETCIQWHHARFKGTARVGALTDKMLKAFKILTGPTKKR